MRVATFNLLHGESLVDRRVDAHRLRVEIERLDADVLGLQEVDRGQARSNCVDEAAEAAAAVGGGAAYRFVPTMIGTPGAEWTAAVDGDEDRRGEPAYGIALVTRLPVQRWHVRRLTAAPMRSPVPDAGTTSQLTLAHDEPRAMLAAVVTGPDGPLTIATAHLSFVPGWNAWQLRQVCRELCQLPAPRLLLGDLNIPGRVAGVLSGWQMLATNLPTYPSADPQFQLDHVLADGADGVTPVAVAAEARAMRISDHRALVVDLAG